MVVQSELVSTDTECCYAMSCTGTIAQEKSATFQESCWGERDSERGATDGRGPGARRRE